MGREEEKEDAEYRMGGRGISAPGLRTQLDSKRAHNPLHPKHTLKRNVIHHEFFQQKRVYGGRMLV